MATALKTYGSWQTTQTALEAEVTTLRQKRDRLTSEVQALRQERSTIAQSLAAVEEEGCHRIQAMADHAQQAFQTTVDHLAQLQAEAAALGTAVTWAQALRSDDPALWQQVDVTAWLGLWAKFQRWLATKADTREFPVPKINSLERGVEATRSQGLVTARSCHSVQGDLTSDYQRWGCRARTIPTVLQIRVPRTS